MYFNNFVSIHNYMLGIFSILISNILFAAIDKRLIFSRQGFLVSIFFFFFIFQGKCSASSIAIDREKSRKRFFKKKKKKKIET